MTPKFNGIYTQALRGAGLSIEQAHIYEALLKRGPRQAGVLPKIVGVSRPYVYKILEELEELGLVTRTVVPGKPTLFCPAHPFAVREILNRRLEELKVSRSTMDGVMGALVSDFTSSSKLPGIQILDGIEGIQVLYAGILAEGTPIRLLRSTRDDDTPERLAFVLDQIQKQVAKGITTRLIGPLPTDITREELAIRDRSRLTQRRIISREKFDLPAQVIIYGNKIGMSSFVDPYITTIIENEAIRETFSTLFETIWDSAENPYPSLS